MIVIDIETTGLDPERHAIVSLGAVDFENPEHTFYSECRVFDGADIDPQSLVVNGFTQEDITAPSKEEPKVLLIGFREFSKLCKDSTLGGQNPGGFDIRFLEKLARREHFNWTFARHAVDLHSVCYAHMRTHNVPVPIRNNHSALNLARILEYVGLGEVDVPHHALEDARLTAECMSRLIHNKPLFSEYRTNPVPWA